MHAPWGGLSVAPVCAQRQPWQRREDAEQGLRECQRQDGCKARWGRPGHLVPLPQQFLEEGKATMSSRKGTGEDSPEQLDGAQGPFPSAS